MAKKPRASGRVVPKDDLYGKTKSGLGNPLPKMARVPPMPQMPKMVPFAKHRATKK